METSIAVFRGKGIRKTIHNNEWWFSVADVVVVLTETANSADYIKKMRKRDAELAKGWGQIVTPLWLETSGFQESKRVAHKGGEVAGKARKDLERKTRKKVVSPENYLDIPQKGQNS